MKKLYGAKWCVACQTLKNKWLKDGTRFEYVDVDENPGANEKLSDLGVRSLPYVEEV
jgi:glutaredoxin